MPLGFDSGIASVQPTTPGGVSNHTVYSLVKVKQPDGEILPTLVPVEVPGSGTAPSAEVQAYLQEMGVQTNAMAGMIQNQGPIELSPTERRKLIKDIRADIKPLINQMCDFQIEKAVSSVK